MTFTKPGSRSCARRSSFNRIISAALAFSATAAVSAAHADCITLSTPNSAYTQNFDSLANTGTSSTVPSGWTFSESGTNANTTYTAGTGSGTAGDTYSFGASASTERAFGTLQSGSLTSTIGACFTNNTGGDLTSLDIAYTGEEWRLGTTARTDELDFAYSTDATDLATGTWTSVTALNFVTPDTGSTGAKDGNGDGEHAAISSTIGSLAIPNNATFWIRWTDAGASGADDGLAVDDFSLTPHGSGPGGPTNPTGTGAATPNSVVAGGNTLLTVTVTPGTNPDSTGLAVTADLSAIGGGATQTFYDDGTNGDDTAGDNVFSFATTVGAATSAGVKSLPVTLGDEQSRSGTASISLTVTLPPVAIHEIQGNGTSSPLAGQTVTTQGNIVTAKKSNGFFMQAPDASVDADPTTSEGIFVFTSSAPTVAIGDQVVVTGKVQEFGGSTELTNPTVQISSSGNLLPSAFDLVSNPPTNDPTTGICAGGVNPGDADTDGYQATNFACLDGMRVSVSDATVTGPTSATGANGISTGSPQFLYAKVTGGALPYRGVGALYPGLGVGIPVWGGEPEVFEVYFPGLSGFDGSAAIYNAGSRVSITGIVQGFKASGATSPIYEVYPSAITPIEIVATADAVVPVADSAEGTLTIATQNLLHFFNSTADGGNDTSQYNDTCNGSGNSDSCPTAAQYAKRLGKAAKQICTVLKAPAVAELEEIENRSVLADIAEAVSVECGTTYVPYLIAGNDPGGINLGLLVRDDVTVNSVTQVFKNTQTVNCSSGGTCLLNDRPPLLLDATYNGYHFAVLAIYDRSLNNLGETGKEYVGAKRAEQAAQIAQIAQAWQSGSTLTGAGNARIDAEGNVTTGSFDIVGQSDVPMAVTGDFNAYEFTDGYVDVTGMIKGTAVESENVYWFDGNLANEDTPDYVAPDPTLVDTGIKSTSRYSYNFNGMKQEIDHILLTRAGWKDFVSIANAHGNSDVSEADPAVTDGSTAARSADHDGQVVTLAPDRIFADDNDPVP